MQIEWNRWLEGTAVLKQEYLLLWIVCFGYLAWKLFQRKPPQKVWYASMLLGGMVLIPIAAVPLLKIYTPFYDWGDLQVLFPLAMILACAIVDVTAFVGKWNKVNISNNKFITSAIHIICVLFILISMTNFHCFDQGKKAGESGAPIEIEEVFERLDQIILQDEIEILASSDILPYVRLYKSSWQPMYGRDLWDTKAASYIASGYTSEYTYYHFIEKAQLENEEIQEFHDLIEESGTDCIIVPGYWQERLGEIAGYEMVWLSDTYLGIIKKELLTK